MKGKKPNILIILADDLGYSDVGCFGGDIDTPNLDRLATQGVRLTEFHNTARCSPSRASLLTGLHPHQAGMAHLQGRYGPYTKKLSEHSVTLAEVVKSSGYRTYMSGKWHVGSVPPHERGFENATIYKPPGYFSKEGHTINGVPLEIGQIPSPFFSTDHMTDQAISYLDSHAAHTPDDPFFLYMAYTAPHFPLQAKEEDINKYKGRFDQGWDIMREAKFERMKQMGIVDPLWRCSKKETSAVEAWEDDPHQAWRIQAMEVYAAMVDCMDQNIGRIVGKLEQLGELDNTFIMFLSDNGGNGEFPTIKDASILPGGPTYPTENGHYGYGWANLSNTPFRMFKHYIHEGGIASPCIIHWPDGLKEKGGIRRSPAQLTDVMATIVDISGSSYPDSYNGHTIQPMEGVSMMPILEHDTSVKDYMFWEHEGNCGIRHHQWKLVRFYDEPWELYDMSSDGTETKDLALLYPKLVEQLQEAYQGWTARAQVLSRPEYMEHDRREVKSEQVVDIEKMKRTMQVMRSDE
jgi:arylsulfatase A-like enzyme